MKRCIAIFFLQMYLIFLLKTDHRQMICKASMSPKKFRLHDFTLLFKYFLMCYTMKKLIAVATGMSDCID